MGGEEDDTEDNAQAGNDNVSDAQEVVATTNNGTSGDNDGLGAPIFSSGKDCNFIVSTTAVLQEHVALNRR
jgi:hypothetical protein